MSNLESKCASVNSSYSHTTLETLFQLKFTAKTLNRQAKKAQKDENSEKARLKKALQQGNEDGARIYASNAIRKKSEALNLLRLSSRIDAVASRVETAVTMRQVTGNMTSVVRGMDKAMESMNLERISMVMDKFESQFADLDVQTSYMEDAMGSTTAVSTPQDQIDQLMRQTAEEADIELQHDLAAKDLDAVPDLSPREKIGEEDSKLAERLRALRPAA
ncbi:Vacuolar protein sorting protein 46 [Mycena kentingensis (nom. inval.)]|nr:Vacuolar protein sorting protein 46 [Mycena kentingensis (nom. inval.)]